LPKGFEFSAQDVTSRETVITVSIRRHRNKIGPRFGKVILPESNGTDTKEAHQANGKPKKDAKTNLDSGFDDMDLFEAVRNEYKKLAGPWRVFSAKTLRRITVGYSSACTLHYDPQDCALHATARSPRYLASRGLGDTFSENEALQHFRRPRLGRNKYAWVHWGRRLAGVTDAHTTSLPELSPESKEAEVSENNGPNPPAKSPRHWPDSVEWGRRKSGAVPVPPLPTDLIYVKDFETLSCEDGAVACSPGLELVKGWSVLRILVVFMLTLVLAIAAVLLWTFLGVSDDASIVGFRDAGSRVGSGLLLGVLVLIMGWTGMAGWMGLSWLVN